jgi:hypothetical protein
MSVSLNELELMGTDKFSKLENVRVGRIVIFTRSLSRPYTWRGMGQVCPRDAKIVCTGTVALTEQGADCLLVGVSIDGYSTDWATISSKWSSPDLFEPHRVKIELYSPGFARAILFERV